MSAVARRMASELLDPHGLEAFLANRLIPLNKCPGLRPIGIGETPRRIISKTIVTILKDDIRTSAGPLQLCCGHEAGCEAIVHCMHSLFEKEDTEAVLLVDADNAFNRLNRSLALVNIPVICPPVATFAINCYRSPSRLFVTGGAELSSKEGTTQGDPLSMPLYALATTPLIQQLRGEVTQTWYADDAQAAGKLSSLRHWWDSLVCRGPSYGYFANSSKTILIVKPEYMGEAKRVFEGTGIQFSDGGRDLGGAIGSDEFTSKYLQDKISSLCEVMETLSYIAVSSPQAAHSAFCHGIRHKWTYLQRIHKNVSNLFAPLETVIREKFIPALLGGLHVNEMERNLLALPAKLGGLAIENPTTSSDHKHQASLKITNAISSMIVRQDSSITVNLHQQREIKQKIINERKSKEKENAAEILASAPAAMQRAVLIAQEKGASSFITSLPLQRYGFSLSKTEFRDAILMRYMWPLSNLPSRCVCGSPFSMEHSQICHTGGFINMRHDQIKTLLYKEMSEVLRDVEVEPSLTPLSGEVILPASANREPDARSDIRARGFWTEQQSAFFDVRVFYPHAPSYLSRSLSGLCKSFEQEKKRKYSDRILQIDHGFFTPLVFSSCGGMGPETSSAIKKLASMVAEKRNEQYSHTISLLRMRISFALIRASLICLRGTRLRSHHNITHWAPADSLLHELRAEV